VPERRAPDRLPVTARPGLVETFAVWSLFALVGLATVVTYARVEPEELYNTSVGGFAGGLGRALVFVNYPVVLAAVAMLAVSLDRLGAKPVWLALAGVAVLLCATVAAPGVVDEDDLDAKTANALPATGVLLALGLSLQAAREGGLGRLAPWRGSDAARVAIATFVLVAAIPWGFAELGFFAPWPFVAEEFSAASGEPGIRAVHLGRHHGMDGALLVLTALALSRVVVDLRHGRLRFALAAYLSILFVYGVANATQDFWLEQVVKRGWTDERLPDVIRPSLSLEWTVLLAAAAAVFLTWRRRAMPRPSGGP
jgi:hypothetical protein